MKSGQDLELALREAAAKNDIDAAKELIKNNISINAVGGTSGMTALHRAARAGHLQMIKLLIEHKASVNCQDAAGNTPLHYVIMASAVSIRQRIEIAEFLLNNKANPILENKAKRTAFMEYTTYIRDSIDSNSMNLIEASRLVIRQMKQFVAEFAKEHQKSVSITPNGALKFFDNAADSLAVLNNPVMYPASGQINVNVIDADSPGKPKVAPHI